MAERSKEDRVAAMAALLSAPTEADKHWAETGQIRSAFGSPNMLYALTQVSRAIAKARAEGFAAGRADVVQVIRMWRDMDREREREMRAKGGISNKESAYEAELRADFLDELLEAVGAAEKEGK